LVKESRSKRYEIRVTVKNTNLELMDWLKDNFGGYVGKNRKIIGWKQAYDWVITGGRAIKLLEKIKDFLIIKREQYLIVITYQAAKIEARKDGSPRNCCKEGLEKWQDAFDYLKGQLSLINKKGDYAIKTYN